MKSKYVSKSVYRAHCLRTLMHFNLLKIITRKLA